MPITNNTPFAFHLLAGQAHPPHRSATLILKGTFDIVPDGTCVPAGKQRPIEGDRQHMDEIGRGPAWASDLVEFKPHTDFYILGSFHQPDGVAAPTGTGGFTLGPLSKDLAFFGPRIAVRGPDQVWTATPPEPFVSLPLRWEYSFGGLSDRRNPMGMGIDQVRSADGPPTVLLPRIEDPAHPLRSLKDRPPPANFAPVPATFLDRRRKLGTRDKHWSVFRAPLPPEDYTIPAMRTRRRMTSRPATIRSATKPSRCATCTRSNPRSPPGCPRCASMPACCARRVRA